MEEAHCNMMNQGKKKFDYHISLITNYKTLVYSPQNHHITDNQEAMLV